ncbi:MAG: hypothetical protein JWR26_4051 [Pedosphaera sp.]|nr:hypothetical protein [Pedosphaera sp.]
MTTTERDYKEAVEAARSRVREKLEAAQQKAVESAKAAREAIEAAKSQMDEKFGTAQRKALRTAKAATEATNRFVHENPWRSILIATLAACTFGYLLGTKRD